ncbi:hypothetical protein [Umezawaea sp. NPDC059074]|uniref:hypothetical protein n=1 Tax=Umezawaea sp. NPDC059074 TaxID=3346716 RepID=UPI0036868B92
MAPPPRAAGVAATLVVLVGLSAGAWALGGDRGDGGDPRSLRGGTVYGDPRLPKSAAQPPSLTEPTGRVSVRLSGSVAKIANADVLGDADLLVLKAWVRSISVVVTHDAEVTRGVWLFTPKAEQASKGLMNAIELLYGRVGYRPIPTRHPEVVALRFTPGAGESGPITYRAHYASSRGVVRVEAFGPDGTTADLAFLELLDAQLRTLPPIS